MSQGAYIETPSKKGLSQKLLRQYLRHVFRIKLRLISTICPQEVMTPSVYGLFFLFVTTSSQLCNDVSYEYCGRKGAFPIEVLRDVRDVNLCQAACNFKPDCQFIVFDNLRKDCHLHNYSMSDFIESCTIFAAPVSVDLDFCRFEDTCSVMYCNITFNT